MKWGSLQLHSKLITKISYVWLFLHCSSQWLQLSTSCYIALLGSENSVFLSPQIKEIMLLLGCFLFAIPYIHLPFDCPWDLPFVGALVMSCLFSLMCWKYCSLRFLFKRFNFILSLYCIVPSCISSYACSQSMLTSWLQPSYLIHIL